MSDLAANYRTVQAQITAACQKAQRAPETVQLLAVSKTKSVEDILAMVAAGQRHFGENYLQEAVGKITALQANPPAVEPLVWHYIGHIQSNKTRDIAAHFDWVHTVDRVKIARRLSDQRPAHLSPLNICIQINISAEASKSGIAPAELESLVDELRTFPGIVLRGLMAIPAPDDSPESDRLAADFAQMHDCFTRLQHREPTVDTLSMGMSADMALAIRYGSTLVRVGTALFGVRA